MCLGKGMRTRQRDVAALHSIYTHPSRPEFVLGLCAHICLRASKCATCVSLFPVPCSALIQRTRRFRSIYRRRDATMTHGSRPSFEGGALMHVMCCGQLDDAGGTCVLSVRTVWSGVLAASKSPSRILFDGRPTPASSSRSRLTKRPIQSCPCSLSHHHVPGNLKRSSLSYLCTSSSHDNATPS